jgi:hypothetical protein
MTETHGLQIDHGTMPQLLLVNRFTSENPNCHIMKKTEGMMTLKEKTAWHCYQAVWLSPLNPVPQRV